MSTQLRPAKDFPVGWNITLLDVYMRNPIDVRVTRHPNSENIVAEDPRGVVYYASTGRIVGDARQPMHERRRPAVELDLLGDPIPMKMTEPTIEDLLG